MPRKRIKALEPDLEDDFDEEAAKKIYSNGNDNYEPPNLTDLVNLSNNYRYKSTNSSFKDNFKYK